MKTKSKILVLILTLALLCGAVALVTSAATATSVTAGDLADKWNAAEDGDTLTLSENITYTGETLALAAGKTLTLDLGGYTLTGADATLLSSAGTLTVKNGKIVMGKASAVATTGGTLNMEALTVTNTATDDALPTAIVAVDKTVAVMNNVYISGKSQIALWISGGSAVTADSITVRNTVLPITKQTGRVAVQVNGNNTVTLTNSLVESVYTGIRFVSDGNDATKNTFLFKNSTLNVTFKNEIEGTNLDSKSYDSGNIYKIVAEKEAHVALTLDGSRIIGSNSGKGIGATNSPSETTMDVTIRNCRLYMGNWGRSARTTLEGTNFFFGGSAVAYNAKAYARAAAGSRSYFTGTLTMTGQDSGSKYEFLTDDAYPLPSYAELADFIVGHDCANYAITTATIKSVLLAPGETLTAAEALAEIETFADVSTKVYDADGNLAGVSLGNSVGNAVPAGGKLLFLRDVTVSPLNVLSGNSYSASLITFANRAYVDMNGHWLSLGGAPTISKSAVFTVKSEVYFYTSREGGGIRFLSLDGKDRSFKPGYGSTEKNSGTNRLFDLSGSTADLNLGYTNVGADDCRKNGFTVLSSTIANMSGGKVTVKGGNYYRIFSDNNAFFNIRYAPTGASNHIVSLEDAYFFSQKFSVVMTQDERTYKDIVVTFDRCVLDNSPIFASVGKCTLENFKVTLKDCSLMTTQDAAASGSTIEIGEGCRYMNTVAPDASLFGANTYGVIPVESATVIRKTPLFLTPAQVAEGKESFSGTATMTLDRIVTENYAVVSDGNVTAKWELGATVTAEGASHRKDNTLYVAKGVLLKNGDTVYTDGKIPTDLTPGTELVAEIDYETKIIAFLAVGTDKTETYFYPGADDAADGLALMNAIKALTDSADITLYKNVKLDTTVTVDFANMAGKEVNLDLRGNTFTVTNNFKSGAVMFVTRGATMRFYSSLPGGCIAGPGDHSKLVSVNSNGLVTFGAYGSAAGDNFSIRDMVIADLWSTNLMIDGGTYSRTDGTNAKLFDFVAKSAMNIKNATFIIHLTGASNGNGIFDMNNSAGERAVILTDCNFYVNRTDVPLFTATKAMNSFQATITGGNFYGLTLKAAIANIPTLTYTISGSPKFMAVEEGALGLSGKTLVTIDDEYYKDKTDSPVSCVLADSTDGTYLVTFTFGEERVTERRYAGWVPTFRRAAFGTYYWSVKESEGITADTACTAKLKSTESKISGNLTLYANITFNLYFRKDGYIKGVGYHNGAVTKTFTDADLVTIGGAEYYLFKLDTIAPKDLSAAFDLDVVLANGESTATYSVRTSLVKYADSVLQNVSESEAGKTLVMALLDYVRETSVALGGVSAESMGIKAIDACLAKYHYTRTEWTKPESVITPAAGDIKGAALELLNTPGFVFFLNDTYAGKNSVTVTVNGVTKDYEVRHIDVNGTAKHCFTVDNIHISNYRKDLTVKLGEQSFTYNFDVYMTGFTAVPAYAHALYSYSLAAEAYLAAQNNH